jgi:hypothetical protein
MRLHALMIAAALAFAGTAFAQTYGTEKPADTSASMSTHHAKAHKHHVAKVKHHVKHHARAMHHEMHARAHMERHHLHARAHMERHHLQARAEHNTRAMGAGPASPSTNLDSSARQHRMDLAYNDWLRAQQRRR